MASGWDGSRGSHVYGSLVEEIGLSRDEVSSCAEAGMIADLTEKGEG